jgi:LacI family transcriptional regulator
VSAFINGSRRISPETVAKIENSFRELGYQPNSAARVLRGIPSKRVGLVVADTAGPIWGAVIPYVQQELAANDYQTLLCYTGDDSQREAAALDMLLGEQVDGLILAPAVVSDRSLVKQVAVQLPVVQVIRRHFATIDSVTADNVGGARVATQHLLDLGRRRIICAAATFEAKSTADRLVGYKETLSANGVGFDPNLVQTFPADPETIVDSATKALKEIQPDAVLGLNHLQVFGFLGAARGLRLSVPHDLGIVCYDELPWSALTEPSLTSISQPIHEIALQATRLLISRMQQAHRPNKAIHHVLPVTMIDRESCGTKREHSLARQPV